MLYLGCKWQRAVLCSTVLCSTLLCIKVPCGTVFCCALQCCCSVLCFSLLCSSILCCSILCNLVYCNAVQNTTVKRLRQGIWAMVRVLIECSKYCLHIYPWKCLETFSNTWLLSVLGFSLICDFFLLFHRYWYLSTSIGYKNLLTFTHKIFHTIFWDEV